MEEEANKGRTSSDSPNSSSSSSSDDEVPVSRTADSDGEPVGSMEVEEAKEAPMEEQVMVSMDSVESVSRSKRLSEPEEVVSLQGGTIPVEAVEYASLAEPAAPSSPSSEEEERDSTVSSAPAEQPAKTEDGKDLGVSGGPTEQSDELSRQPLPTELQAQGDLAPQVGRRSCWLSCCGLWDFFGGSNSNR